MQSYRAWPSWIIPFGKSAQILGNDSTMEKIRDAVLLGNVAFLWQHMSWQMKCSEFAKQKLWNTFLGFLVSSADQLKSTTSLYVWIRAHSALLCSSWCHLKLCKINITFLICFVLVVINHLHSKERSFVFCEFLSAFCVIL